MQQQCGPLLLLTAALSVAALRESGALRSRDDGDVEFRAKVEKAWKDVEMTMHMKDDSEEDEEKEQGNATMKRPVAMQVSEEQMNALLSNLSTDCGKQFRSQMEGKGPHLSEFGGAGGPAGGAHPMHGHVPQNQKKVSNKESCHALNGSLCATQAHVVQENVNSNGRKMTTTVDVDGDGCLPSKCLQKGDLDTLSHFMQSRAKEQIPGMGVQVELHVDCSASGGSKVSVRDAKSNEKKTVDDAKDADDAKSPEHQAPKSGAGRGPEATIAVLTGFLWMGVGLC